MIAALFALGHQRGRPWLPGQDAASRAVATHMQQVRFAVAGLSRSYFEFYQGFGLLVTVFLAIEALLLWQLGTLAERGAAARAMVVTHLAAFTAVALISARYVFAVPTALAAAIAACTAMALVLWERAPSPAAA
ncbi:MAG: hypothetical protein JSS29_01265 [Proteobacteria bacterium]|nr:hypothetical protein [Pseudomonadota bacterium]